MIFRSGGSGSYITLPYQYLTAQNPNKKYCFDESFCVPFDGYDINGWNACSVYAVAMVLHHHLKYVDGIDFDTRANRCKEIAVEKGYAKKKNGSVNYYIIAGKLKGFAERCIRCFNANLTVDSDMIGTWNTTKNEIKNGRPVILNILSAPNSNYVNHSVVAYGWSLWNDESGRTYRFLLVKDGREMTDDRYVDFESIGVHYITKIY